MLQYETAKVKQYIIMETYSGKHVLDQYLELKKLAPDCKHWTLKELANNPPRLIRLRQFRSLCKAFSLGDARDFEKGEFVTLRELNDYDELVKIAEQELKLFENRGKHGSYSVFGVQWLFRHLLAYRTTLDNALTYGSGAYEASGMFLYALNRIHDINQTISGAVGTIDGILTVVISPQSKTVAKAELVKRFRFPDVKLSDVDSDWL